MKIIHDTFDDLSKRERLGAFFTFLRKRSNRLVLMIMHAEGVSVQGSNLALLVQGLDARAEIESLLSHLLIHWREWTDDDNARVAVVHTIEGEM